MVVFGPLLHIKNGNLPRGVRKVETGLPHDDLILLKGTIPNYDRQSLLNSLRNSVSLYQQLQTALFDDKVQLQQETAKKVMMYFDEIENKTTSK